MIWFSAFLVAVAVGLLVAGVVTSKLLLVYIAIGVSGAALLALGAGAVFKRGELFGKSKTAESELRQPEPVEAHVPAAHPEPQVLPLPATVPAGSGWPVAAQPGPSLAGYLPTEQLPRTEQPPGTQQPLRTQPPAAASAAGRTLSAEAWADGASAVTAWGSGIPPAAPPASPAPAPAARQPQAGSPGGRPADVQRFPAAFTPRAAGRQQAEEGRLPAGDQPPAEDQLVTVRLPADQAAKNQPPAEDQLVTVRLPTADQAAKDQPPAEDRKPPGDQAAKDREQPVEQPQSEELLAPADNEGVPAAAASALAPAALPADNKVGPAPSVPAIGSAAHRAAGPTLGTSDLQREVTVVPGVPRYHNSRCLLIRFMGEQDLERMTLGAARKAGCTPCRACLPDQPAKNPA